MSNHMELILGITVDMDHFVDLNMLKTLLVVIAVDIMNNLMVRIMILLSLTLIIVDSMDVTLLDHVIIAIVLTIENLDTTTILRNLLVSHHFSCIVIMEYIVNPYSQ